jgi:hypothetical protein
VKKLKAKSADNKAKRNGNGSARGHKLVSQWEDAKVNSWSHLLVAGVFAALFVAVVVGFKRRGFTATASDTSVDAVVFLMGYNVPPASPMPSIIQDSATQVDVDPIDECSPLLETGLGVTYTTQTV